MGSSLEVEVLLHGCLKSCIKLMELSREDHVSRLLDQRLILTSKWVEDLKSFLLKHYWVTSQTMQTLRRRPTEQ